jgi:predicted ATPase
VLAAQFPETAETQPELLAHHYTEAGLAAQAIPYWLRAGQGAIQHSANVEAISHLTTRPEGDCQGSYTIFFKRHEPSCE